MDYIKYLGKEICSNTIIPYEDLPRYDLFLSQVIDFLNDKFESENYTNNIVQNYVKNEVISKPEDGKKRGYTKNHLAQLVLLSYMRPVLTTEEIKKVFGLVFNDINDRHDDIISWENAYRIFSDIQQESFEKYIRSQNFNEEKFQNIINELNLTGKNAEKVMVFLVVMSLIAQSGAIKKFAQNIVDKYQNS
jgi:uncharacterized protein YeeX (DUF496 family)